MTMEETETTLLELGEILVQIQLDIQGQEALSQKSSKEAHDFSHGRNWSKAVV